ncbi:MAG: FlgD immunoglobulin-like domain containing protein, partial [Chloroflexota bacterium]
SIPDQWIYTEAGGLSIEPQYFEISSVTVTITNDAGEVIRVTKSSENPGYIAWDGKQNGELLPAGDYPVVVVVCDTNNKCSTTAGRIEIPAFNYIIPTPEQDGKPEEIVVVPPPPVVEEEPMPIIKFASTVFGSSRKTGISIAFLTGGVLLLFAVQNISDPRPRAMRSLAGTIRKTMIPKE